MQEDLALSDFVMAKLDAHDEATFQKVNEPVYGVEFASVIKGLHLINVKVLMKVFVGWTVTPFVGALAALLLQWLF